MDVKIFNTVLNSETNFNTENEQRVVIKVAESSKRISLDSIVQTFVRNKALEEWNLVMDEYLMTLYNIE